MIRRFWAPDGDEDTLRPMNLARADMMASAADEIDRLFAETCNLTARDVIGITQRERDAEAHVDARATIAHLEKQLAAMASLRAELTRLVRAVGLVLGCESVMCRLCVTVLRDAIAPAIAKETP